MRAIEDRILALVYEQYSGKVYLYLYSLCRNSALAQDLMQETFYRAMLSLGDGQDVLPWLMKVAKNLFIGECRKGKWLAEMDAEDLPDGSDVLQTVITGEKKRRLYTEIQKLPAQEKEAVTLYYFAGLSQMQTALQLGLSYANVRTLLHRVRKKLYERLKEDEHGI